MNETNSTRQRMTRRTAIQGTALLGLGGLFNTVKASDGTTSSETQPNPRAVAQDVKREVRWAWKKYKKYAWGHDHLEPVTGSYRRRFFDEGLTIVESLDTLYLLGLDRELERAIEWIENELTFDVDYDMSVFEGTIRYVGGLLSGYKVTGNEILLQRAQDFANRLYPAFEQSPSGMPYADVNLKTGEVSGDVNFIAEIGTHIPEWGELSRLVGDDRYYTAAKGALRALYKNRSELDLIGAAINVETEEWEDDVARIGPPVDSFYEYLWDGWRLFDDSEIREWFDVFLRGIENHMVEWYDDHLWYKRVNMDTGELVNRNQSELAQFFAGLLAESGNVEQGAQYHDAWTQIHEKFGLPPGLVDYSDLSSVYPTYWLRPEYLGSTLLLYDKTGDDIYRDRGYRHYKQMKTHCKVENGYTTITDVTTSPMKQGNVTPGYWWSENMKYFYLLFQDNEKRLDEEYYLTTEGNVLRGVRDRPASGR